MTIEERASKFRSPWRAVVESLEPLWVSGLCGLALALAGLVCGRLLGLRERSLDLALYLTTGVVLLALNLAPLIPWWRGGRSGRPAGAALAVLFTTAAAALLLLLVITQRLLYLPLLALAQLGLTSLLPRPARPTWQTAVALFIPITLSWYAAASLVYWAPLDQLVRQSAYTSVLFILAVGVVGLGLATLGPRLATGRFRAVGYALNGLAVVVFAVMSTRSFGLFGYSAYYHWGVLIGPAALVRQGGWLLWDVPTTYGFLSTLVVALSPFASVWQAMYALNALLLFASAVIVFWFYRRLGSGWINTLLALVVALAVVYLLPGARPEMALGPYQWPSTAAFRFIWVFALLALLAYTYDRRPDGPVAWRVLLIGSGLWLLGSLWSPESAIYCAVTWLPAYLLMVLGAGEAPALSRRGIPLRWQRALLLAFPLLLLGVVVAGIVTYYQLRLGHRPDFTAFYEILVVVGGGYFSTPLSADGPFRILLLVLVTGLTAAVYAFSRTRAGQGRLLLVAATGALWSTGSYFALRGIPSNATSLGSMLALLLAAVLLVASREPAAWTRLVQHLALPPLVVLLVAAYSSSEMLGIQFNNDFGRPRAWYETLVRAPLGYQTEIERKIPELDANLYSFLREAGVQPQDRIVYLDSLLLGAWPTQRTVVPEATPPGQTWLPLFPWENVRPFPNQRLLVYAERFVARAQQSGWLLQHTETPYTTLPWLSSVLAQYYTPADAITSPDGKWQLIWFANQAHPQPPPPRSAARASQVLLQESFTSGSALPNGWTASGAASLDGAGLLQRRDTNEAQTPPYDAARTIDMDAGVACKLTFEYRNALTAGTQRVYVIALDERRQWLEIIPSGAGLELDSTGDWKSGNLTFVTPRDTRAIAVILRNFGLGQTWFRNVRLDASP
ncbi:MAG: hypothetical protein KIT87_23935 [Anaerolineae bacterium]|nr:hypothetical protein [Anaerolineae bacterium]